MSYDVDPSGFITGSPAFGFAIIGIFVTEAMSAIISPMVSGPAPQFAPTAAAPNDSRTMAAVFASVPKSVLPSDSKVRVTMTAISDTSLAAISAALHS